ncbi:MAG: hypothetical protein JNL98_18770 [Bryobacterales bacterium]|nr:hypothetical protein [Bryobacterales bacterium]
MIGYEDKEKRKGIKGEKKKLSYLIKPMVGTGEFRVIGPNRFKGVVDAWDPANPVMLLPGKLSKEDVVDGSGKLKMRADSSAVFKYAGDLLKKAYPATECRSFANVHDDFDDGGNLTDSLNNFMEEVTELADHCTNLDYFAYSGHGNGPELPSAGLKINTKRYEEFVECLRSMLRPDARVIFYACSTGLPGGMAPDLSKRLPGITVYGHNCAGHGMTNPEKVRCVGGQREVFQTIMGPEQFSRWSRLIKMPSEDIWLRYPWMTIDEIRAEVDRKIPRPDRSGILGFAPSD